MLTRTFPDSGVLIDAARGAATPAAKAAMAVLGDAGRIFLTSDYVWLESMPKAQYMRRTIETAFYESFFARQDLVWCRDWDQMHDIARAQAASYGLGAMDALHVAAAYLLGADELVTAELPRQAICRVELVRVVSLYNLIY